jgi:hypothetical protein
MHYTIMNIKRFPLVHEHALTSSSAGSSQPAAGRSTDHQLPRNHEGYPSASTSQAAPAHHATPSSRPRTPMSPANAASRPTTTVVQSGFMRQQPHGSSELPVVPTRQASVSQPWHRPSNPARPIAPSPSPPVTENRPQTTNVTAPSSASSVRGIVSEGPLLALLAAEHRTHVNHQQQQRQQNSSPAAASAAAASGRWSEAEAEEERARGRRRHRKRVARIVVDHWKWFAGDRLAVSSWPWPHAAKGLDTRSVTPVNTYSVPIACSKSNDSPSQSMLLHVR